MELRKTVYGPDEAAIEWFLTVSETLEDIGWTQMRMGRCVREPYGDAHGQLRAILGARGWRPEQSGPMHSADTSRWLSMIPSSPMQTINETIRLVDRMRERADLPGVIHSRPQVQMLGRADNQMKLRGFRIEIGEIEAVIRGAAGAKDAVVILTGEGESKFLAAYVTPASVDLDTLSAVCASKLANYMVPSSFQKLERLPVTDRGKLDKKALPAAQMDSMVDAKGLSDKLQATVYAFRDKEKRTYVKGMTLKEGTQATNNWMPWVHGDAQLVNSLTKGHELGQPRTYFNGDHRWKMVRDARYQRS